MPIVDVHVVQQRTGADHPIAAQPLADALGKVFASAPGRTWVRVHTLNEAAYAENGVELDTEDLPVFVTVLHARPPAGTALAAEVVAVTDAVALCLGCSPERVHVQYAPPGEGRQAFGGKLV